MITVVNLFVNLTFLWDGQEFQPMWMAPHGVDILFSISLKVSSM